jgi:hypothetical protein
LADVGAHRAEREQPLDLGVAVVRPEVEVQPVLRRLRLGHADEDQTGEPVSGRSDLDLVVALVDHHPAECLRPPPAERDRVCRVDSRLLPFERHGARQ